MALPSKSFNAISTYPALTFQMLVLFGRSIQERRPICLQSCNKGNLMPDTHNARWQKCVQQNNSTSTAQRIHVMEDGGIIMYDA
jgi:hypothetical protein